MYGFNQPECICANYYSLFERGYDAEDIFVFPASEKKLYEVFLWVGQELAREESLRQGTTWHWFRLASIPPAPAGVCERMLLGTLAQAPYWT